MSEEEKKSHTTVSREASSKEEHKHTSDQRPMGTPFAREEIDKMEGHYDDDGFFILKEDESFFDPWGYKFDPNGYDEFGGYYDDDGFYVPGEKYEDEYYRNYEHYDDEEIEQYMQDEEEEEETGEEEKKEETKKQRLESKLPKLTAEEKEFREFHIVTGIKWLKEQPADKKNFAVRITSLPLKANQDNVIKFLEKQIKPLSLEDKETK